MANFLDKAGVQTLWAKTKAYANNAAKGITDKLGEANGIATLGADSKLTASQLPTLKTINGNSVVGSGNITIDLSLYKIVDVLPTSGIEDSKIYLVLTTGGGAEGDIYTEYIYVDKKWEQLGQYKANVDLTPYAKKTDVLNQVVTTFAIDATGTENVKVDYSVSDPIIGRGSSKTSSLSIPKAGSSNAGVMSAADKTKLDGIDQGANNYKLPTATASVLGGVKVGSNLSVDLNGVLSGNYALVTQTANGIMDYKDKVKLDGIYSNATADSAITETELNAILV